MQQRSAAAQRFYQLYYRWATLSHTTTHQHLPRQATCLRGFHASARSEANTTASNRKGHGTNRSSDGSGSSSRVRKINVRPEPYSAFDTKPLSVQIQKHEERTDLAHIPKFFTNGPVQTAVERPFNMVSPEAPAVRYRSPTGLMLETAVPEQQLSHLQKQWGSQLEELSKKRGIRIEVQDILRPLENAGNGERARSVLLSGTFDQVARTYSILRRDGRPSNNKEDNRIPSIQVRSPLTQPSATLIPLSYVARRKTDADMEVELSLLESQWMKYVAANDINALASKYTIQISVGEPELRPCNLESSTTDLARSFYISGQSSQVFRAVDSVVGSVRRASQPSHKSQYSEASETMPSPPAQLEKDPKDAEKVVIILKIPTEASQERQDSPEQSIQKRLERGFVGKDLQCDTSVYARSPDFLLRLEGPSKAVNRVRRSIRRLVERMRKDHNLSPLPIMNVPYDTQLAGGQQVAPVSERQTGDRAAKIVRGGSVDPTQPQVRSVVYSCYVTLKHQQSTKIISAIADASEQLLSETGCSKITLKRGDRICAKGTLAELHRFEQAVQREATRVCVEFNVSPVTLTARYHVKEEPRSVEFEGDPNLGGLRPAFRTMSHPVVLITARGRSKHHRPEDVDRVVELSRARGVTVSSFTTVTMEPVPIISFNLKVPSRSWDAIRNSSIMRIHLLRASQQGAAIAHAFTQPYKKAEGGFERLEKLGIPVKLSEAKFPPAVGDSSSVIARLGARLLPSQCVEVGDHVIVVAEVVACQIDGLTDSSEGQLGAMTGLAYADRAYRDHGREIEPDAQAMNELDPLSLGTAVDGTQPASADDRPKVGHEIPDPVGDIVYEALRAARDAEGDEKVDIFQLMSREPQLEEHEHDVGSQESDTDSRSTNTAEVSTGAEVSASSGPEPLWSGVDLAREESARLAGNDQSRKNRQGRAPEIEPQSAQESTPPSIEDTPPPEDAAQLTEPLWASDDVVREESQRLATNEAPRSQSTSTKQSTTTAPFGISRRTFFTAAISRQTNRSGSTHATQPLVKDAGTNTNIADLVEASARKVIVADYLGVPDDGTSMRPRRVRSLLRLNKDARWAERKLIEKADQLSEDETLQLQQQVAMNDRKIAKKLAWNAVDDLRLMLDKGRVDFKRAQFFESAIEKGQAVLLEDAKYVRKMAQEGKLDKAAFEQWRTKLEHDHGVLSTETNRLRQVVEEGENAEDD